GKYLSLVASTRDQDVRRMAISTAGDGDRDLLVSYISEVPIWKCTYRIVVPKEGKPLLECWAIVDNTVGEDWRNVELSLVAGAPQSFVQELSQPYYTRRPVVALPQNAMITPQTHEATMEGKEAVSSSGTPTSVDTAVVNGTPGANYDRLETFSTLGAPKPAMPTRSGIGAGSAGGLGGGAYKAWRPDATAVAESLEAATTTAQARALGDLFEYKLQD